MLLMYDYANGSGWKVVDLYQEMFQHWCHPNHKTFSAIVINLEGSEHLILLLSAAVNWGREIHPHT
jgi:hypothetical protein